MGCVSSLPSDKESVNTHSQSNIVPISPSTDSFIENPNKNIKSFPFMNEGSKINEGEKSMVLTEERLREHTMECEFGNDLSSISTISSSKGDNLKQIGNELQSMKIYKK